MPIEKSRAIAVPGYANSNTNHQGWAWPQERCRPRGPCQTNDARRWRLAPMLAYGAVKRFTTHWS
jgi:hypothetical protein